MSTFFKPAGYLAAFAAVAGVAGCGSGVNGEAPSVAAAAQDERPVQLPQPPLKIPMPLDKAGYKVDVTFEVPPLPKRDTFLNIDYFSGFVGLRVLFAPGTSEVFDTLKNHPVAARIFLSRIEDGQEVPISLFSRTRRSAANEPAYEGEPLELPEGEAIASLYYARHTAAPAGTPDASTFVLSFASSSSDVIPGIYRLQVETLDDIPELRGVTSFLVYEKHRRG